MDEAGWSEMDETRKHFIIRTTKEHAVGYIKAAGPGVAFIAAGEVLQGLSHATLARRYQAVNTALAGTAAAFSNYRERVRKDQGPEKDYEYLTGGKVVTVEMEKRWNGLQQKKFLFTRWEMHRRFIFLIVSGLKIKRISLITIPIMETLILPSMIFVGRFRGQMKSLRQMVIFFENQIREYCQLPKTMAGQSAGVFAVVMTQLQIRFVLIASTLRPELVYLMMQFMMFRMMTDYDILFEFVVTKYDPVDRHEIRHDTA